VAYFEVSVRTLAFDRVFCCWMWHSAASLVHVGVLGRDWGCIRSGLGLHRNHTCIRQRSDAIDFGVRVLVSMIPIIVFNIFLFLNPCPRSSEPQSFFTLKLRLNTCPKLARPFVLICLPD